MKKNILALMGMLIFLIPIVSGAVTIEITNPSENEDLTIDQLYNLTGTITDADATNESFNCLFYEKRINEATFSTVSMVGDENMTAVNSTTNYWGQFRVPNEFGRHDIQVRCTNTTANTFNSSVRVVDFKRYSIGEASESIIDLVIAIFVALVGFGTLISLVLIYKWFRKKGIKIK